MLCNLLSLTSLVLLSMAVPTKVTTVRMGVAVESVLNRELNLTRELDRLFLKHIRPIAQSLFMSWDTTDVQLVSLFQDGFMLNKSAGNVTAVISVGSEAYLLWVDQALRAWNVLVHVAISVESDFQSCLSIVQRESTSSHLIQWHSRLSPSVQMTIVNAALNVAPNGVHYFLLPISSRPLDEGVATEFDRAIYHMSWLKRSAVELSPCGRFRPCYVRTEWTSAGSTVLGASAQLQSLMNFTRKNRSFWWLLSVGVNQQVALDDWSNEFSSLQREQLKTSSFANTYFQRLNVALVKNFCLAENCLLHTMKSQPENTAIFLHRMRKLFTSRSEIWTRLATAIFIIYQRFANAVTVSNNFNATFAEGIKQDLHTISSSFYIHSLGSSNDSSNELQFHLAATVDYHRCMEDTNSSLNILHPGLFFNVHTKFPDDAQVTLTALAPQSSILSYGKVDENGNLVNISSFNYDILVEISRRMNFRLRVRLVRDGKFGNLDPDTNAWNGAVKDLMDGLGDVGLGTFASNPSRVQAVDVSVPIMEVGLNLLLPKPQQITSPFRMFSPYQWFVWLLIIIAFFVATVSLYACNRLSPFSAWNLQLKDAILDEVHFDENMWVMLGSCLQQGQDFHPNAHSSRVVLATWWIVTVLIVASYTANLTAYLSQVQMETSINNLEDLLKQDTFTITFVSGTSQQQLFRDAPTNSTYRKLYDASPLKLGLASYSEAWELILRERRYAFVTESISNNLAATVNCSRFVTTKDLFNVAGYVFIFPRNSPFLNRFNEEITSMKESGLVKKLYSNFINSQPRDPECIAMQQIGSQANTLSLRAVAGAFVALGSSVVAGSLLLLCEFIMKWWWNRRQTSLVAGNV